MEKVMIGHWYGHYDSRGGSQIVIGAKTEDEALLYHLERNFCVTQAEDDELWSDLWRNIKEDDFMRTVIVRFFNEPKEQDLIYDDKTTGWALVKDDVKLEEWTGIDGTLCYDIADGSKAVEEIWVADEKPTAPAGYKIANLDQFGEDAFGVVIQLM